MTAVAVRDNDLCPDCGATITVYAMLQDALFFHGGYGATGKTMQLVCGGGCGWSLVREVSEIRPPKATP